LVLLNDRDRSILQLTIVKQPKETETVVKYFTTFDNFSVSGSSDMILITIQLSFKRIYLKAYKYEK